MAKISFFGADGEEKSYTLHPQLTLRVGRDPGNDVVLRDPKVSRRHAEIVFERGFFVLHDLQSANGTYVNGIRVNVAPLTNGAELKIGNSHARFVDEPDAVTARPKTAAGEPAPPRRQTAEIPPEQLEGTSPHNKTRDRVAGGSQAGGPDQLTGDTSIVEEQGDTPIDGEKRASLPPESLAGRRYQVEAGVPWGEVVSVRDDAAEKRFHYRRVFNIVALVAAIVAGLVLFAGSVVTAFLAVEKRPMLAIVAAALTIMFTGGILLLVPKRHVQIFSDEALSRLALVISEESMFGFPIVTFRVRMADGTTVGFLAKNAFLGVVKRRWEFLDVNRRQLGVAIEEGFGRPFFRKFFGDFFGLLTTDYALMLPGGAACGAYRRRQPAGAPHLLELSAHRPDPRLAIAFALLVDSVERTR
ncbi:MAG: FHA domain-containing protein [Thermoanaerobaculia bacterium]|nr:FHA domain-containing protein [Thermoanaerobaculia bacterium]